jgi:F-type H+/Na+-transporting ATPase subunit alpha
LQPDLFNSGFRPAIDAGNSVSRVGGAAQTPAIKSVAGKMKLELAQYNNLAAFAQFGSELDEATTKQLERGKRTIEILKQPQFASLPESLEYLSIWLVTNGQLDDIAVTDVSRFESGYHDYMKRKDAKLLDELSSGAKPTEEMLKKIQKSAEDFKKGFK